MWKKEDAKSQAAAENSPSSSAPTAAQSLSTPRDASPAPAAARSSGVIGQGIRIKGEVTASEDLFIDGHIEGKLNLNNTKLTVGPNGQVKADIMAREVVVLGRVDGKIVGRERIQLGSTSNVAGDLQTERLAIEDGALLRGKIEIETGKPIPAHTEARGAAAGAAGKSSVPAPAPAPAAPSGTAN